MHTPGPWMSVGTTPREQIVREENGDVVAIVPHNMPRGEYEANARLLSAAPDLDAAADAAWKALAWVINYDSEDGGLRRAMKKLEAARKRAGTFDYDAMREQVERNRPKSNA